MSRKIREYGIDYYARKYQLGYHARQVERRKDHARKCYEDNKEYYREYQSKYYEDNKEYFREYRRKYYKDNKEKIREYNAKWRQTPQGRAAIARSHQKRRELEKQVEKYLTDKGWSLIQRLQYNECACCHRAFNDELIPCRDHIYPVIKGGPFIIQNIQALCRSCNSKKNTKYIDYRTELHKYIIYTYRMGH